MARTITKKNNTKVGGRMTIKQGEKNPGKCSTMPMTKTITTNK